MWEDPIVAEVHRTREKLAAQYNFDIAAYFADLRRRHELLGSRLIRQKKRSESSAEAELKLDSGTSEAASSDAAPAA